MGYYTQYTLTEEKNPADPEKLEAYLQDVDLLWLINERDNEATKWYEHDEDMKALSKVFPTTVFKLHGDGEEVGDSWERYYHNGNIIFNAPVIETFLKPDLSKY